MSDNSLSQSISNPPASVSKAIKKANETTAIKLLPKLIEALRWGNKQRYADICESIADSIESCHPITSQKIRDVFKHDFKPLNMASKAESYLSFEDAQFGFEQVILPAAVESECRAIVQEHHRSDDLQAYGLAPRHKVLLYGTPGNGKTMLAEALAYELDIPFLRVKYSSLIDSHLGESSKNLEIIMNYAYTAPCLLFLDEFDGIGMDRNDNRDVGEMRRITNHLLISLDRLPATCVFVGATNAPDLIDKALKRRFDFVIEIPAPTKELKLICAKKEFSPTITPGHNVLHLAEIVSEMPLSNLYETVKICRKIRRDLVLNDGKGIDNILIDC